MEVKTVMCITTYLEWPVITQSVGEGVKKPNQPSIVRGIMRGYRHAGIECGYWKTKHAIAGQSSKWTLRHLSQKNEYIFTHKPISWVLRVAFFHNVPTLKSFQLSFHRCMAKMNGCIRVVDCYSAMKGTNYCSMQQLFRLFGMRRLTLRHCMLQVCHVVFDFTVAPS